MPPVAPPPARRTSARLFAALLVLGPWLAAQTAWAQTADPAAALAKQRAPVTLVGMRGAIAACGEPPKLGDQALDLVYFADFVGVGVGAATTEIRARMLAIKYPRKDSGSKDAKTPVGAPEAITFLLCVIDALGSK